MGPGHGTPASWRGGVGQSDCRPPASQALGQRVTERVLRARGTCRAHSLPLVRLPVAQIHSFIIMKFPCGQRTVFCRISAVTIA